MLAELHALAPITWRVAFLESYLDRVERDLREWRRELGIDSTVTRLREPLAASLERLEPLEGRRDLLVETRDGRWTAWFSDDPFGGTDISPASVVANRLGVRMVHLVDTPQTISADRRSGAWGAVQLQVVGPDGEPPLYYRRVVSAVNDAGRWVWDTSGEPFEFEDLDRYEANRVRDRFPSDLLETYAAALGIEVSNPAWYGPAAALVEAAGRNPHPAARSLEAARRSFRIGGVQ